MLNCTTALGKADVNFSRENLIIYKQSSLSVPFLSNMCSVICEKNVLGQRKLYKSL